MALRFLSKLAPRYVEPALRSRVGVKALKSSYKAYERLPSVWNRVPRITVYRGVSKDHHYFDLAKEGVIVPRNFLGTTDIDMHNYGTSNSALTSWTRSKAVAATHAGEDGVILEASVPGNRIGWSPDVWYEQEVLVRGMICDAKVSVLKPNPKL